MQGKEYGFSRPVGGRDAKRPVRRRQRARPVPESDEYDSESDTDIASRTESSGQLDMPRPRHGPQPRINYPASSRYFLVW